MLLARESHKLAYIEANVISFRGALRARRYALMTSSSIDSEEMVLKEFTASLAMPTAPEKAPAWRRSNLDNDRSCMMPQPRRIGTMTKQTMAIFQARMCERMMATRKFTTIEKIVPMIEPLNPPTAAASVVITDRSAVGVRPSD